MSIRTIENQKIEFRLYTKKAFYIFYLPVGMPYQKTLNEARTKGYDVDSTSGIIEECKLFGTSWIGVNVTSHADDTSLKTISGEFKAVEVLGDYKQISKAYDMIMKENKNLKEFYNIYYNNPKEVQKDELRTVIIFR